MECGERAAAPVAEWQGLCLRTPLCLPKMAVLTGLGRGKAGLDEAGYKDHGPVSRLGLYAVLYICRDVLDLPCGDRTFCYLMMLCRQVHGL